MPMKNLLRSYVVKIWPLFERFLKLYCEPERNNRSVTLVGSDLVLIGIYSGETKELWQMEGRVKRDIWYMEHWSVWLDIRIIWLTIKTIFIHDKHAY